MSEEATKPVKQYVLVQDEYHESSSTPKWTYSRIDPKLMEEHGNSDPVTYLEHLLFAKVLSTGEVRANFGNIIYELKPAAQVQLTAAKIKSL